MSCLLCSLIRDLMRQPYKKKKKKKMKPHFKKMCHPSFCNFEMACYLTLDENYSADAWPEILFPAQTVTEARGSQGKEVHYTSGSISPSVRTIPLSMKDDSICLPSHSACPSAPAGPCLPAHRPPWFVRICSPGMIIDLIGGDEWRAFYGAWIISWRQFWGMMGKVYGSNGQMVLLLFDKPSTRAVCSVRSRDFSGIASSGRRSVIESWLWCSAKSLKVATRLEAFACACWCLHAASHLSQMRLQPQNKQVFWYIWVFFQAEWCWSFFLPNQGVSTFHHCQSSTINYTTSFQNRPMLALWDGIYHVVVHMLAIKRVHLLVGAAITSVIIVRLNFFFFAPISELSQV